jgi:hypothetical protein
MRASLLGLVLLAGCQPQGSLVHVFVDATPALTNISQVIVNATVETTNHKTTLTPSPATHTPFDVGVAFPSNLAGKMANISVDLFDNSAKPVQLGTAVGSIPVPAGGQSADLHLEVGGGPSLCPMGQTTGPLCDGFEGQLMQFWNPPVTQNAMDRASAVEVVQTMAKRGASSLHVSTGAIGPNDMGGGLVIASLNETTYMPVPTIYVRMFVYVPQAFNKAVPGAFLIIENSKTFAEVEVSIDNPSLSVFDSINGMKYAATGDFSYDSWHCVELELQNGNPGAVHLWLDENNEVVSQGGVNTNGDFNEVAVGLVDTITGSPDREMWIDEVAVDSQRIHCDK